MEPLLEKALLFAEKDPILYCCIPDGIKSGAYSIVCASQHGVLAKVSGSELYIVASDSPEETDNLISDINAVSHILCLDKHSLELLQRKFSFKRCTECLLYVFTGKEPIDYNFPYEIKNLDMSHASAVCSNYKLTDESETISQLKSGKMIGAFDTSGDLMGFIGLHSEQSVGMLVVMPRFRRLGVAYAIEAEITNRLIKAGRTPYCHVILGNTASMHLQEKLGYTQSKHNVYWIS